MVCKIDYIPIHLINLIHIFDKMYLKGKLHETFNQDDTMNQPMTEPAPVITPTKPVEEPVITPSRKDKPFLPILPHLRRFNP